MDHFNYGMTTVNQASQPGPKKMARRHRPVSVFIQKDAHRKNRSSLSSPFTPATASQQFNRFNTTPKPEAIILNSIENAELNRSQHPYEHFSAPVQDSATSPHPALRREETVEPEQQQRLNAAYDMAKATISLDRACLGDARSDQELAWDMFDDASRTKSKQQSAERSTRGDTDTAKQRQQDTAMSDVATHLAQNHVDIATRLVVKFRVCLHDAEDMPKQIIPYWQMLDNKISSLADMWAKIQRHVARHTINTPDLTKADSWYFTLDEKEVNGRSEAMPWGTVDFGHPNSETTFEDFRVKCRELGKVQAEKVAAETDRKRRAQKKMKAGSPFELNGMKERVYKEIEEEKAVIVGGITLYV